MPRCCRALAQIALFLCCALPAQAQTNPPVASCGLPAEGVIRLDVTYTLTANCQLTGVLNLNVLEKPTVTVNGAGFTITGRDQHESFFKINEGSTLTINSATLDGELRRRASIIDARGTVNLNDVTVRRAYRGPSVYLTGTGTFTRALFVDNDVVTYGKNGAPSALQIRATATATITNAVFRGNYGGGGAVTVESDTNNTATLTTNGCLSFSGNIPYNLQNRSATWTKNHSGACTGTIGNSASADISNPALLACGIPGRGNLNTSARYSLNSNCSLGASKANDIFWHIGEGANIEIVGNGYTISGGSGANYVTFRTAIGSELDLENVAMDRVWLFSFGDLKAAYVSFTNVNTRAIWLDGEATLNNVLFKGNTTNRSNQATALMASSYFGGGKATLTNAIFRENVGTHASNPAYPINTLHGSYTPSASITLEGCVSFIDNTPSDKNYLASASVTDNSTGACSEEAQIGHIPASPPAVETANGGGMGECFQPLGNIGCVSRREQEQNAPPTMTVWHFDEASKGYQVLNVTQPQIDAMAGEGLLAQTDDLQVAIYLVGPDCVYRDEAGLSHLISAECVAEQLTAAREGRASAPLGSQRFIAVAKGPNFEGKVHVVYFDGSVGGRISGTVDVYIGRPGIALIDGLASAALESAWRPAAVIPQLARADGSLVHVVGVGDTVNAIALAYGVSPAQIIALNNLPYGGRWIFPGQELLIRRPGINPNPASAGSAAGP